MIAPSAAIASAMATVRRAISACSSSTIRPSTVITPLPSFSGSANAAMILRAKATSASGGANTSLAIGNLVGVDQRLAVEAQSAALRTLAPEAVAVLEVVVDAVEHVEAVGAAGGDRRPTASRAPAGDRRQARRASP